MVAAVPGAVVRRRPTRKDTIRRAVAEIVAPVLERGEPLEVGWLQFEMEGTAAELAKWLDRMRKEAARKVS